MHDNKMASLAVKMYVQCSSPSTFSLAKDSLSMDAARKNEQRLQPVTLGLGSGDFKMGRDRTRRDHVK